MSLPNIPLIKVFGLNVRKDGSYIWEDKNGNSILKNTFIEDGKNDVLIMHKSNLALLLKDSDFTIIFVSITEKRLFPKSDERKRGSETHPWMYYLTFYELNNEGVLKEIFHNSFEDARF